MRISDWSSDVCSSELIVDAENEVASSGKRLDRHLVPDTPAKESLGPILNDHHRVAAARLVPDWINKIPIKGHVRSEEHTSEPQSLMRISYAVFCLQKKNTHRY